MDDAIFNQATGRFLFNHPELYDAVLAKDKGKIEAYLRTHPEAMEEYLDYLFRS